jgi:hypothetical protein
VQLLDLPFSIRSAAPSAALKRSRRPILKLLLPRIDLVRVNLAALGQIGHSRLLRNASKAIPAFSDASIFRLVLWLMIRSV